jgi:hypothetical protein
MAEELSDQLAGDELTFVAEAPELLAIVGRAADSWGLVAPADCDRWKRLVRPRGQASTHIASIYNTRENTLMRFPSHRLGLKGMPTDGAQGLLDRVRRIRLG